MKVLVTGAGGFAGRAVVTRLRTAGLEVIAHDRSLCDLRDAAAVSQLMVREHPTIVIHLAASAAPGMRSTDDFDTQYDLTIRPALNVAAALPNDVCLAIFVGSIEEYGRNTAPFFEDTPTRPISAYGWAKAAAHEAVCVLCEARALPFVWVRPSLLYGPGMSTARFLGAVAVATARGSALDLTGCEQTRDFLYMDDFAEMIWRMVADPAAAAAGAVFNLSTEGRMRLIDALNETKKIAGPLDNIHVGALPYRDGEIMEFHSSGRKFRKDFGAIDATPFALGLAKTIKAEAHRQ